MTNHKWSIEIIKGGVERFEAEQGRLPTARDFDDMTYLPSARQIQRMHGGMSALRLKLGYGAIDFTKGEERRVIATSAYAEGLRAEDELESVLVSYFGEPYVHIQKRYGESSKNRYDFFIYAQGKCFGVDIFSTQRLDYLAPNIRHKILKYGLNTSAPVIFVVAGDYTQAQVDKAIGPIRSLATHTHLSVMSTVGFIAYAKTLQPLNLPPNFRGVG